MSFEWGPFSTKAKESILTSDARQNIWEGSVRSAKTIASIVRWLWFVKEAPSDWPLLMVGKTERTLKRNVLDPIIEMVGQRKAILKRGSGEFRLFNKQIELVGANDERSEGRIRGLTAGGCYGDEITLWPESFYSMMLSRLSVSGAKFFGTTNPDGPSHWFKKNYLDRRAELNMRVFHFTIDDNPTLDPTYVSALKNEYTGLWYRRFIKGEWCLAEGAVWDMFDVSRHVIDTQALLAIKAARQGTETASFNKYIAMADYATGNPTAFLLLGFDNPRGPYFVVKEYYHDSRKVGRQKTDAEYVVDYKAFTAGQRVGAAYVDPSAASFILALRRASVTVVEAENSVIDGIRFVGTQFAGNNLFIDKSCVHLREEIEGYVWDAKAQARGEDKPVKVDDHACDAMRYGLYTAFGKARYGVVGGLSI